MSFFKAIGIALLGSVVANLIIMYALRDAVIDTAMPLHALSIMPVVMLTVIGVIGALIVYSIMRAFMSNPNRAYIWIAIIVLIISFIPDYLIIGKMSGPFAGGNVGSALVLALMHIATALIVVASMVKVWGAKGVMKMEQVAN